MLWSWPVETWLALAMVVVGLGYLVVAKRQFNLQKAIEDTRQYVGLVARTGYRPAKGNVLVVLNPSSHLVVIDSLEISVPTARGLRAYVYRFTKSLPYVLPNSHEEFPASEVLLEACEGVELAGDEAPVGVVVHYTAYGQSFQAEPTSFRAYIGDDSRVHFKPA